MFKGVYRFITGSNNEGSNFEELSSNNNNNNQLGERYKLLDKTRRGYINKKKPGRRLSNNQNKIKPVLNYMKNVLSNSEQHEMNIVQSPDNSSLMVGSVIGNRNLRERSRRKEELKKRLNERRYNEQRLLELRGGININHNNIYKPKRFRRNRRHLGINDDQIYLLNKEIENLHEQLKIVQKEQIFTKRRLEFAEEKNYLLESLLDDGKIDSDYLKSRRHMGNFQKDNIKPSETIPASPIKAQIPLFTSSPIKKGSSFNTTKDIPIFKINENTRLNNEDL